MSDTTNNSKQGTTNPKQPKRVRKDVDDADDVFDESPIDTSPIDIKSLLMTLSEKMDTLQNTMSTSDTRLNTKIDNLDAMMSTRINDVKADLDNRIQEITNDMDQRLVKAMDDAKVNGDRGVSIAMRSVNDRVDEIRAHHESRLDRLERYSLEKDIIISGVPLENDDKPFGIIGDICAALNCSLKQGDFSDVFRLRHGGGNSKNIRSVPIVARLQDDWAKQQMITAYFRKKNLNLKDIGFRTATRIYINERLTATNREIFNRAAEAKKSNFIHRFYTRRGLVYVQRHEKDRPACMFHISDLDVVFPLNYERQRNVSGRRSVPTQQGPVVHPTNAVDMVDEFMDTQPHSASPPATDPNASDQKQQPNGSNSSQANE